MWKSEMQLQRGQAIVTQGSNCKEWLAVLSKEQSSSIDIFSINSMTEIIWDLNTLWAMSEM